MSQQTKQVETLLKEKESQRYAVQMEKESLEKTLVELNESNLKAQSSNYRLSTQQKLLSSRADKQGKRLSLLNDKVSFLTDTMGRALKEQQDAANRQDSEFKNLQA